MMSKFKVKRGRTISTCLLALAAAPCSYKLLNRRMLVPTRHSQSCVLPAVFVGVFSGPDAAYSQRRTLLRSTWFPKPESAKQLSCELGLDFRFVIGRADDGGAKKRRSDMVFKQEQEENLDLLLLDVLDNYRNLPKKTISFFQTALTLGGHRFVLKMDDDLFLAPLHLAGAAHQWSNMQAGYIGCMHKPSIVVTNPGHVWYEPLNDILAVDYHMYACGSAYALSRSAISKSFTSRSVADMRLLANEDTTVGLAMLAHTVVFFDDRRLCASSCNSDNSFIVVNGVERNEGCSGLRNPAEELPALGMRPECKTMPPPALPLLRSKFDRFNAMMGYV